MAAAALLSYSLTGGDVGISADDCNDPPVDADLAVAVAMASAILTDVLPGADVLVGGVVLSAAAAMAISIFIVSIVGTPVVTIGAIVGFPVLGATVGTALGSNRRLGPTVGTRVPLINSP